MTLSYDLYWSFRSPYSYMVTPRLQALDAYLNGKYHDSTFCEVNDALIDGQTIYNHSCAN